ncbi:MAG: hypothetical protein ABIQ31_16840 [Ferruginibacter sp.]
MLRYLLALPLHYLLHWAGLRIWPGIDDKKIRNNAARAKARSRPYLQIHNFLPGIARLQERAGQGYFNL